MSEFDTYKNAILDYLRKEKSLYQYDIDSHIKLSAEEKERLGLLIRNAKIVKRCGSEFLFSVEVNNTKLRPGDKVTLIDDNSLKSYDAIVIENGFEQIELMCKSFLKEQSIFSIMIIERVFLDTVIDLTEMIEDGASGSIFLQQLLGEEKPVLNGLGGFTVQKKDYMGLNDQQINICDAVVKRPSIYCIQGPPGTGKTDVLATISILFSKKGKDVLIISNTHQAVNNALNKIVTKSNDLPLVKIGEELKAQELDEHILIKQSYNEYIGYRKTLKKKHKEGSVLGMTLHAAIVNLGLRNSGFKPSVIMVDEAGQMPFAESVCIGSFGCGSVIFIGDDKQMPPIFHEGLKDDPFSKSIFSFVCEKYPYLKGKLNVTYRMNEEITNYVSERYYEPYNEKLISSEFSKDRKLSLNSISNDCNIKDILNTEKSLFFFNVSRSVEWEDYNDEEAQFISSLVKEAVNCEMSPEDIAVITPYRKQVRTIREYVRKMVLIESMPLIDTVERLQGQDVDMIIVSLCVSSYEYFKLNREFLLSPNRLNVMISRAKKKVVVLGPDFMLDNMR